MYLQVRAAIYSRKLHCEGNNSWQFITFDKDSAVATITQSTNTDKLYIHHFFLLACTQRKWVHFSDLLIVLFELWPAKPSKTCKGNLHSAG